MQKHQCFKSFIRNSLTSLIRHRPLKTRPRKVSSNLYTYLIYSRAMALFIVEHKEFLKMRKQHYKNEFSPAMLLKKGSANLEEEDETK